MHNHSIQPSGGHTHSLSVSVGYKGLVNPCGEIELADGEPCSLAAIEPQDAPFHWMIDDWNALDDILYALKEDELAASIGLEEAKKVIQKELGPRRVASFQARFKDLIEPFYMNHTHNIHQPGFSLPIPIK